MTIETSEPEPKPSLDLIGPDTARVGTEVCYTARVRDASGVPMEGAQVLFVTLGGERAEVLTDAAGAARFCFLIQGPETVSACLDLDRNSDFDEDEPTARLTTTIAPPIRRTVTLKGPSQVLVLKDITSTYTVEVVYETSPSPLEAVQIGFHLDPDQPPTIIPRTTERSFLFTRSLSTLGGGRSLTVRAWLDEIEDEVYSIGEPTATVETKIIGPDDACEWLCSLVTALHFARVGDPDPDPEPTSTAIRLRHPYLQNLLLCAEPVALPAR